MNTANLKRMTSVEVQLTPKDWAIRLADEFAKHVSCLDHSKTIAKYHSIDDSLFGKPFLMLEEQADQKYSGIKSGGAWAKARLYRQLRYEYHALKLLLSTCNQEIADFIGNVNFRIALSFADLRLLIALDAGIPLSDDVKNGIASQKDCWIKDIEEIIAELICYEIAIVKIQEKYFDGHTILFKNNKAFLSILRKISEDLVSRFNDYIKRAKTEKLKSTKPIDLKKMEEAYRGCLADAFTKKWVEYARNIAKADILRETADAEDFLWEWCKEEAQQNGEKAVYEIIEKEGGFTCRMKEQ